MKLADHVEQIRKQIDTSFRNRLGRMGITPKELVPADTIPEEFRTDRKRIEPIREVLIAETGTVTDAYEKLVEEFTFTLFNRLAALKVMEAHTLHPEVVTRRSQHGDRSFAHKHWLEQNPAGRNEEMEGLVSFMEDQLEEMATDIPLFSTKHPYHLLPTTIELNGIISAFNQVETDAQVETDIWKSDDVLGWLYESYNNYKKAAHKESGDPTEYNKVSIQSQVYTPRWVVKFLVDNSLGKLYIEMYPDSDIKNRYKIANAPKVRTREPKSLTEIKLIDPAPGSGNFLLYAFDLFYDLYLDQIENFGAEYDERKIAELIITHNLHGVDLDDRAIQLAQLGLYIKAKRKSRSARIDHFNVVSSDFYLPPYAEVQQIFEANVDLDAKQKEIIRDIWADLQQAYKFGSLIRLEEKLSIRLHGLTQGGVTLFSEYEVTNYEQFRDNFFTNLQKAIAQNTAKQGQSFLNTKTQDAITFLKLITQKYDVASSNPPYTDSADFGPELRKYIETNYRKPNKFNTNLYATFIKRCYDLCAENGYIAIIHTNTLMFINTFESVRNFLIRNTTINILVEYGLDRVNLFGPGILLDAMFYVLNKKNSQGSSLFFDVSNGLQEKFKKSMCSQILNDVVNNKQNNRAYQINQEKFFDIDTSPFIYWISDDFRQKFKAAKIEDVFKNCQGLATANNNRFLRYWWEIGASNIYTINSNTEFKKWYLYAKGGPYNKWYGNNWLAVNWQDGGHEIKNFCDSKGNIRSVIRNEKYYFKQGITYSASGGRKSSYRILPENYIFDVKGSSIFSIGKYDNIYYLLSVLNSKLSNYVIGCLNPTVEIQVGDIKRIPFIQPTKAIEDKLSILGKVNIRIKKKIDSNSIFEFNFSGSPLKNNKKENQLTQKVRAFIDYENYLFTLISMSFS